MKVPIKALLVVIVLLNSGFALTACSEAQLQKFSEDFECGQDDLSQGSHGGSAAHKCRQAKAQARLQAIEDAKPLAQKQAEAAQKQAEEAAEEAATKRNAKENFNSTMDVIDKLIKMDAAMHGESPEQTLQRYNQESKESLQRQKDYRLECNLRYTDSRQRQLCYTRYSN